ncbi:hypothetical protein BKA69DRAFT_1077796 [Paraphysoderma sedebokerense]|nr:hypothetical protein BKA69DRAFT_1077796 [Paraphysoderma sedebokerense]
MTRQLVEALTSFWRCHFANKTSRSEMVLVLGEPAGLEQELRNDVSSACDLLEQNSSQNSFSGSNLNNVTEFKDALLAALETHSKIESTDFGAYYIEDHQKRITLAICPTFEELRLFLRHISATTRSRDLRIVYCGHGTKSGEIMLFEDNEKPEGLVSGGELRAVFNDLYWSSRPQLSMWFNCCYGLDVVAQMTDEKKPDELKKKLRQFVKATGVDVSVFDIIEEFEAKLRIRESNDLDFQRMIEGNRSLWMAGRGTLSIGVLHGAGELGIVFGNPEHSPVKSEAANNQKIRRLRLKDWEKYPEQCEALFTRDRPGVDCKNEDDVDCPTIQAMQAHCGDSSVIRFRSWAFLIDGGFISTAPCYWKSIQDLAHLHMVILTHGDCDHVNGLRPFFQWRLNYKNRLSHRKPNPEVRKLVIQRGVLRLREWKHAIDLANVAQATLKDEEIADENNIVTMEEQELFKETDDTYGVTVRVILPSSDLAKNANIKLLAERYANRLDTASKELADARNPDIKKGVVKIAKLLQKAKGTEDLAQLRQCGQDIANQFNSEQLLDMNVPDSVKEILEKLVDLRYTEGAILRDTTLINRTGIVLLFKFSTEKNSKLALLTGDADGKDLHENLQKKIPEGSTERSPADGRIHINYVDVPHHGASFTQNNADFLFDKDCILLMTQRMRKKMYS